ncbi:MAG: anthranilate synthase component I family protein [Bacteroidia bacterium]
MEFRITTTYKKLLADTVTPVSIYLKLRDHFPNSILLESADQNEPENSSSFICIKPFAGLKLESETLFLAFPDGSSERKPVSDGLSVSGEIDAFMRQFRITDPEKGVSGLFGYITYDAVRHFEDIRINAPVAENKRIPDLKYDLYQYVIAIDHFRDVLVIYENSFNEPEGTAAIEALISKKNFASYRFSSAGNEESNYSDEEFAGLISSGKKHCKRGDVFQVVLSREFSKAFTGDEFNVYRALRSINPSPYLFYFDLGNFKLFGSSPEAQLVVRNGKCFIHPIAGTFRRTGNDEADQAIAEKLRSDPKENAEHVMLVDLARNDLGKNCTDVELESFREVKFYSHVVHLVSNVSGKVKEDRTIVRLIGDTFPAGTLSGAPKYRAMQLIDKYENKSRSFYGGCIGFMGFDGTFNSAIMIRSFLSKNNRLFYQAGAGVVESSDEISELNEVNNKLAALKTAIKMAEEI